MTKKVSEMTPREHRAVLKAQAERRANFTRKQRLDMINRVRAWRRRHPRLTARYRREYWYANKAHLVAARRRLWARRKRARR
jgi:hypothetical protein